MQSKQSKKTNPHPKKDEYLASYGQTFTLLAAPPGTGKSVGIIIPKVLTYADSLITY